MRVFWYSLAGVPLLVFDALLMYSFPVAAGSFLSREEGWIVLGGALAYLLLHLFLRKPERFYLWGHEFSHVLLAKLFFREIRQFHISSRDGGKVVIDRTNVMIDLAPYILPLYCMAAGAAATVFRNASPWVPDIYLGAASFLFTMHLLFSAEGFIAGQPDLKRSGRIFSAGVVLLFLQLWIPFLMAPGVSTGWSGAAGAYREWFAAGGAATLKLFAFIRSLLFP